MQRWISWIAVIVAVLAFSFGFWMGLVALTLGFLA